MSTFPVALIPVRGPGRCAECGKPVGCEPAFAVGPELVCQACGLAAREWGVAS